MIITHCLSTKDAIIAGYTRITPWRKGMNNLIVKNKRLLQTPIIDLGGSKKSSYNRLINKNIISVNIDPKSDPDVLADLENTPIESVNSNSVNTVLCLNVLEHIFNFQDLLNETYRMLKQKGHLILGVPFVTAIHKNPNDYYRFTPEALIMHLRLVGYNDKIITYRVSTGILIRSVGTITFLFPRVLASAVLFLCSIFDRFLHKYYNRVSNNHISGVLIIARHP